MHFSSSKDIGELEAWVHRIGAELLPIKVEHVIATWNLRGWSHKDPFDRLLATQTIRESATLVTADPKLQALPNLKWLWKA